VLYKYFRIFVTIVGWALKRARRMENGGIGVGKNEI